MADLVDIISLKLHCSNDGSIWYIFGEGVPKKANDSITDFLLNPLSTTVPNLRLIGCPNNAALLLCLFNRRLKTNDGCIEVCSPLVCKTKSDRNNPKKALYNMRLLEMSSSLGGWHIFDKDDYPSYAITASLQKYGKIDDHIRRLLKSHIVWPELSFIPHLNIDKCAELISIILDPRWFIDICHPNRGSHLRSFLSLNPRTMYFVVNKKTTVFGSRLCKLVLDCWYREDLKDNINHPAYFLYRILNKYEDKVRGLLRASQNFVEFLRLIWIAKLNSKKVPFKELFIPAYFFKSTEEINAFNQHIKTYSTTAT